MGQMSKEERKQIVMWKTSNMDWNLIEFMDSHPEYKNKGDTMIYYWETAIYLAQCLGLEFKLVKYIFEEMQPVDCPSLIFILYLIKLYEKKAADKYFALTDQTWKNVHNLIRELEEMEPLQVVEADEQKEEPQKKEAPAWTEEEKQKAKELFQIIAEGMVSINKSSEALFDGEKRLGKLCIGMKKEFGEIKKGEASGNMEEVHTLRMENALLKQEKAFDMKLVASEHEKVLMQRDYQISDLKRERDALQTRLENVCRERDTLQGQMDILDEEKRKLQSQIDEINRRADKPDKSEGDIQVIKKDESIPFEEEKKKQKRKKGWRTWKKDQTQTERYNFLMEMLQSGEYPEYQRDFIQKCYDEGMELGDLKKFEKVGIPEGNLEMMKAAIEKMK